jgi:hypothetical protein
VTVGSETYETIIFPSRWQTTKEAWAEFRALSRQALAPAEKAVATGTRLGGDVSASGTHRVCSNGLEGYVSMINREGCNILGLTKKDIMGKTV